MKRLIANLIIYTLIILSLPITIPCLVVLWIVIKLDYWSENAKPRSE